MTHTHSRLALAVWRWPVALALAATIPAFYLELLQAQPPRVAAAAYLVASLMLLVPLLRAARGSGLAGFVLHAQPLDLFLVTGLALAAVLPASSGSTVALGLRVAVALLTLLRLVLAMQHLITRGGLLYLLLAAGFVLGLCGAGFWWLEPLALTLSDGLWLAFTTAATVGYGDIVPSTPASKIFSVFVVMLGFGVLSLVTAAIATRWIETEERIIEREILRDVHRQMDALRGELAAVRLALQRFTEISVRSSQSSPAVQAIDEAAPGQSADASATAPQGHMAKR